MELTVKQFLFGGIVDGRSIEGFNSFSPEFANETYKDFSTFVYTVQTLLEEYGWDTDKDLAVDYDEADQTFQTPDTPILYDWYCQRGEGMIV